MRWTPCTNGSTGDRPRVVFNDAQASRKLEGWDRARWARHLAVKVLAVGDVDPPRPVDAAPCVAAAAVTPATAPDSVPAPLADAALGNEEERTQQTVEASETLAAELEALLASDEGVATDEGFGSGLDYAAGQDQPLTDDPFPAASALDENAIAAAAREPSVMDTAEARFDGEATEAGEVAAADAEPPQEQALPETSADTLALVDTGEDWVAEVSTQADTIPTATFAAPAAPDSWSLVEQSDEASEAPSLAAEAGDAAVFGIEKLSAADYLAPAADDEAESPIVLGMSLELVSMEEAVAPQEFEASELSSEMVLGEASVLKRLVVLGATTEGTHSVSRFLAALPADLGLAVLHTQHLSGRPAEALVEHLAEDCALPVRLAEAGRRALPGEVLVVPSDKHVRVLRDGTIVYEKAEAPAGQMPSIDGTFTQAATVFGRDTVAIVFAGHSTDAFAGCQAVHDRGGQVWVEEVPGEHAGEMVGAIVSEHLSHYAGTPQQLAARLSEHFSKEVRP